MFNRLGINLRDNQSIPHLEFKNERLADTSGNFWIKVNKNGTKNLFFRNNLNYRQIIDQFKNFYQEGMWSNQNYYVLNDNQIRDISSKFHHFRSLGTIAEIDDDDNTIDSIIRKLIAEPKTIQDRSWMEWGFYRKQAVFAKVNIKVSNSTGEEIYINLDEYNDEKYTLEKRYVIIYLKDYNIKKLLRLISDKFDYSVFESISEDMMLNVEGKLMNHVEFYKLKNIKNNNNILTRFPKFNTAINQSPRTSDSINLITKMKLVYGLNEGLIENPGKGIIVVKNINRKGRPGSYHRFITNGLITERTKVFSNSENSVNQKRLEFESNDKSNLKELYNNPLFSDMTFVHTGTGKEIIGHKVVYLLEGTKYTKSMLTGSFREGNDNNLPITTDYLETFDLIIRLIYGFNTEIFDYVESILEIIYQFNEINKNSPYNTWKSKDNYDNYKKNIDLLYDLMNNLNMIGFTNYFEIIQELILKNANKLMINLGQINYDIAQVVFTFSDSMIYDKFVELELLNYFEAINEDEEQQEEDSGFVESKNGSTEPPVLSKNAIKYLSYLN